MNKKPETLEEIMERIRQNAQQVSGLTKQLESQKLLPNMRNMLEEDLKNYEHGLQHWLTRLRAYLRKQKDQLLQEHYRLSSDLWEAGLVHDVHQVASLGEKLREVNLQLKAVILMISTQELCITAKTLKAA